MSIGENGCGVWMSREESFKNRKRRSIQRVTGVTGHRRKQNGQKRCRPIQEEESAQTSSFIRQVFLNTLINTMSYIATTSTPRPCHQPLINPSTINTARQQTPHLNTQQSTQLTVTQSSTSPSDINRNTIINSQHVNLSTHQQHASVFSILSRK